MSEQPPQRPMPPAPVLPPPQSPAGHQAPGTSLRPWATQPPHAYQQYGPPGPPPWQQPGFGYGAWQPPPPRRTSSFGRILLGLVGVAAALFFVLILIGAALGSGTTAGDPGFDHSPAPARPGGGGDPETTQAVLTSNPLYRQGGLANGACPAESLGDAGKAEQTRFYTALMGCLDAEWGPPVEAAGFSYSQPGLLVFDAPVSTPCGSADPEDGRTLAFYCPSDSVMYADVPQMRKFFGDIEVAYAIVIGHEFGHHVQFETRVLDAFDDAVYADYAKRLELSRRVELQASCMGGLFLGAIADTFPMDSTRLRQLEQVAGAFGDEPDAPENQRDHGTGASNRQWIMTAFDDNDIATCNTFTAPADDVD